MSKSSIHIKPVTPNSEKHNERQVDLDYVRKDLCHKNEYWKAEPISDRLKRIKENYTKTVGRKMHSKSTPIREGVVLIKEDTSMVDLATLSDSIKEKLGVSIFQIHIHRDEGHHDKESNKWMPNLHAHLVFDWTNEETGISIKLSKQHMSQMQTLVAEELGMERGVSSDKKHISSLAFKVQKEKEELENEIDKYKDQEKKLLELKNELEKNGMQAIKKNSLGLVDIQKTTEYVKSIILENKKLGERLAAAQTEIYNWKKSGEKNLIKSGEIVKQQQLLKAQLNAVNNKIKKIINAPKEQKEQLLFSYFSHLSKPDDRSHGLSR